MSVTFAYRTPFCPVQNGHLTDTLHMCTFFSEATTITHVQPAERKTATWGCHARAR
ncbi:hypothetical protein PSAC2689_110154 [Paraburkholderia sacchari]